MHRSLAHLLVASLLVLATLPARAQAQQGGGDLRIGAGMVLDFGGGMEYDPSGPANNYNDNPKVTPGFRLHIDKDIARYVSLGGYGRFSWWRGTDLFDNDRNMMVDLGGRVTGHYDWRDFRFYGTLMIGPSISKIGRDNTDYYGLNNPAVGVNAGLAPGAEYWFDNKFGVFCEIFGWNGHFFTHDRRNGPGSTHFSLNQVLWQFGLVYAP